MNYIIPVEHKRNRHWLDAVIMVAGLLWFSQGVIWLGIVHLVLAGLGYMANNRSDIVVSESGISYPSLPTKKYEWNKIERAILKDGILTIDLKNNKLIQLVSKEPSKMELIENDFNTFCTSMIAKSNTEES